MSIIRAKTLDDGTLQFHNMHLKKIKVKAIGCSLEPGLYNKIKLIKGGKESMSFQPSDWRDDEKSRLLYVEIPEKDQFDIEFEKDKLQVEFTKIFSPYYIIHYDKA